MAAGPDNRLIKQNAGQLDPDSRAALRGCHPPHVVEDYLRRGAWRQETILELFDRNMTAHPTACAVSDPTNLAALTHMSAQTLSWAELASWSHDISATLYSAGIRAGDVIALLLPNSAALVATYIAIWRLGAIASPMPMSYRLHEIGRIVVAANPVAAITVDDFQNRQPVTEMQTLVSTSSLQQVFSFGGRSTHSGPVIPLDGPRPHRVTANEHVLQPVVDRSYSVNDCVTICWTSGTEGVPKGVPRCHGDWLAIGQAVQDGMAVGRDSVVLAPFPMVNMAGIASTVLPWLLGGGHLVLHHPLDVSLLLNQIRDHRVTHASMAPAMMAMVSHECGLRSDVDLSTLAKVGVGGSPLSPNLVRDWQYELGIDVINFFGSNEGLCLLGAPADIPDPLTRARYLPNYSSPTQSWTTTVAQHTDVRLVDIITGSPVIAIGGRGELRLKGPTVFGGYLDGTAAADPFDDDGYYCSGDIFELAGERGEYVKFVDRSKEIIIRGGMNISPAEVESLLSEHPAISDVAIVGYPDDTLGEKCCAVVVPCGDTTPTLQTLVAFLRERQIASFKLPEKLVVASQLPRSPAGKLLRRDIAAALPAQESQ